MISLRQIEAFRAVMVTGTVTQAAKMLEVSQPAVSRMISYLEYEIGFKLFSRASRQLIPTDEGRAFYDEVERSFIGPQSNYQSRKCNPRFSSGPYSADHNPQSGI